MSILNPDKHGPLIKQLSRFCAVAGIPVKYVETSMKPYCTESQIKWVVDYRKDRQSSGGLVVSGENAREQCLAIGGALLRDYIDVRVRHLDTVLSNRDDALAASVLVIPDFYITTMGSLQKWESRALFGLLGERSSSAKPTIVVVDSLKALGTAYGSHFVDFLTTTYTPS